MSKEDSMKKTLMLTIAVVFGLTLMMGGAPADVQAKTTFVTIGTGGITGVYYPTGGAIAKMVNAKREEYGIRATVESTGGSAFNVNAIMAGDLEFGVVQSDRQYQAYKGEEGSEWAGKPQPDLRAVFSIHPESVTLCASVDSGIKTVMDLKGKRVNLGNPGSGHLQNSKDTLKAVGLDPETDLKAEYIKAAEAPGLLQDGRIDAFFYTVGHPSGAFKEATAGKTKVMFVPIEGPGIDKLVADNSYYAKSFVPVADYPGAVNDADVPTFGVKATFCTSAAVPDEVVYAITKEVFDNFDTFKKLHPAYAVLTKEGMLEGLSAPIHPGAMKYYKEVGLK
jgi:TRAP transporter TAXI family solute receptor